MDKSDYSEVKELITTNSNCPTNSSPFDGGSVVFYGAAKDDSFQKGVGNLRSFRKVGADNASRHELKGTYNNQRSEKDSSAWAMVHEVGHGLHFSEAAADIAFVTKNALALRDAHSKESLTAPFKSIQTPKQNAATDESQPTSKHQIGSTRPNNNSGNIFSFNSSNRNVKAVSTEEPYDDDSNFEKESTVSFDFDRHRSNANVINPLTKPAPSKWDDAEKWLSAGESAPAKTRPKNSPLGAAAASGTTTQSARKGEAYPNPDVDPNSVDVPLDGSASDGENHTAHPGFDAEDMSAEKMNKFLVDCTKKVEAGSKKSLLPRFAFMTSGKPLPLPLPVAPVALYPLEDVFGRDNSNARESSTHAEAAPEPFSVRTAKPTAGVTIDAAAAKAAENGDESLKPPAGLNASSVYAGESGVVNMRTVCMRDMGTEMTPIASVDPSRTATPLMATTPNLGSPAISRPSSLGRVRTITPSSGCKDTTCKLAGAKALDAAGKVSSGLSGKEKTRAEILALGTQLGKSTIAAWATKEEEEADAAQALKASLEMEEVRKNLLASRAAAWEEAEQAKYTARFKREEAKIQAWENHEKAKAEAEMRRVEGVRRGKEGEMKVAVVGVGVAGLTAARTLAKAGSQVTLYEKEDYIGGHARTLYDGGVGLDTGFMVFNRVTYPNMLELFEQAGVEMEESEMSFSVSLDAGRGCEWGSNSLGGLFAQRRNVINPSFLNMLREIVRFKQDVLSYLEKIEGGDESIAKDETLGEFLVSHNYSNKFRDCYLVPMCGSVWSCPTNAVLDFPAEHIFTFCKNHHLLQLVGRPQWLTVKGRSETYVNKMVEELEALGATIRRSCGVTRISSTSQGVEVEDVHGRVEMFERCLVGSHAPDTLQMLGEGASFEERTILGAFQYSPSTIYLHRDDKFMPRNQAAWCAWNFLGDPNGQVCVTYWLNILQNLGNTGKPYFVTLNPSEEPRDVVNIWRTSHPIPSRGATKAIKAFGSIQGKRGIWFCGAYQGYGFHEDGLKAGLEAAFDLLGTPFKASPLVKQMVPTYFESAARAVVTSFLRKYIRTGHVQLFEDGGTVYNFFGKEKGSTLRTSIRVHNPAFYWKISTRQDLGLADAYVDGDFSFVDPKAGLLNFFLITIANRDIDRLSAKQTAAKGTWWSPVLLTSALGSATSYLRHVLRGNSLTNTRRNISQHYDLSNEMFASFLDPTMTYSCAIFKGPEEPLIDAQMRKINHLIDKARVESTHEVLELGSGWGALAIQLVRRTGCHYTGITLSQEQLEYAQDVVKAAGLEDKITFLLVDYRNVQAYHKFNRIISCEMLEAVGHEYYAEWFRCCDDLLAKDGLVVVQVISIPEERYDAYRQSSDFIKEYIFPGGCLPSFAALTAAMGSSSSFCVEHMENIGIHYCETLLRWQDQFQRNRNDILNLGFDEKFIRTWDYYFFYCAAGFKSCTLGVLQIVFSRPGNEAVLGSRSMSFPTAP